MLEHVHHRVPVTALAFYELDVILAGEGNLLKAYEVESKSLAASLKVFDDQAIHGIELPFCAAGHVIVYGGRFVRVVKACSSESGFPVSFELAGLFQANDWILAAAYVSTKYSWDGAKRRIAFVTAHNGLIVADEADLLANESIHQPVTLDPTVPGSNCVLYSAHVTWLSASQCLIASGTAFGDVIVWSCSLLDNESGTARSQIHYTFSAHEGSVFGVHISEYIVPGQLGECKRALATCSDDRTIGVWDITDLTTQSPPLMQLQHDTGFGAKAGSDEYAAPCLAKAMGHVSRIWQVRFVAEPRFMLPALAESNYQSQKAALRLMSFGEDASNISWTIEEASKEGRGNLPYKLKQHRVQTAHSGKHIWSFAHNDFDDVATGGADGVVAIRPSPDRFSDTTEVSRDLLGSSDAADNFKAYAFVDSNALLCTTNSGRVVLLHLDEDDGMRVEEVASAQACLRGYSVVTGIPGYAFVGGADGTVYYYIHKSSAFSTLPQIPTKVAGLFACRLGIGDTGERIALLVTPVDSSIAHLVYLETDESSTDDVTLSRSHCQLMLKDDGIVVTGFTHMGNSGEQYAVVGSRDGCLSLFHMSTFTGHSVRRRAQHVHAHGKEAVTALYVIPSADGHHHIYSTGRDGTHAVFRFQKPRMEKVHQLTLPFGPNVEGLSLSESYQGNHLWLWGFRSTQFIVYDATESREIMTVDCGGAHRNWAFDPQPNGGIFVWTKASKLYMHSQTELPYQLINSGGHGREIKCVAVFPGSEVQVVATGAEDTNIKLYTSPKDAESSFTCVQTLRKHNTGIQRLTMGPELLFSSGGFEEFFIWRLRHKVPGIGLGVVCESVHPNSGKSDLRIMDFVAGMVQAEGPGLPGGFRPTFYFIDMLYSDSSMKRWKYQHQEWELYGEGDYLTACLTRVRPVYASGELLTMATDGHIATWATNLDSRPLTWSKRYKVHQNAILGATNRPLDDGSHLITTGGDDNAIGITRWNMTTGAAHTIIVPRAHAAAVTGVVTLKSPRSGYLLVSASIDQRVKLWDVQIDLTKPGVEGVEVKLLQSSHTAVADVSNMDLCRLTDGSVGILVCGVGMDVWRLKLDGKTKE